MGSHLGFFFVGRSLRDSLSTSTSPPASPPWRRSLLRPRHKGFWVFLVWCGCFGVVWVVFFLVFFFGFFGFFCLFWFARDRFLCPLCPSLRSFPAFFARVVSDKLAAQSFLKKTTFVHPFLLPSVCDFSPTVNFLTPSLYFFPPYVSFLGFARRGYCSPFLCPFPTSFIEGVFFWSPLELLPFFSALRG